MLVGFAVFFVEDDIFSAFVREYVALYVVFVVDKGCFGEFGEVSLQNGVAQVGAVHYLCFSNVGFCYLQYVCDDVYSPSIVSQTFFLTNLVPKNY